MRESDWHGMIMGSIMISYLKQRLRRLAEECLETINENEALEVHHFNSITYLLNYSQFIQLKFLGSC